MFLCRGLKLAAERNRVATPGFACLIRGLAYQASSDSMKYVIFMEYKQEEMDSAIKASNEVTMDREKHPDKWPKQLTPIYQMLGDLPEPTEKFRGLAIHEVESEEQLRHYDAFLRSTLTRLGIKGGIMAWVPVLDSSKWVEEWQNLRK